MRERSHGGVVPWSSGTDQRRPEDKEVRAVRSMFHGLMDLIQAIWGLLLHYFGSHMGLVDGLYFRIHDPLQHWLVLFF